MTLYQTLTAAIAALGLSLGAASYAKAEEPEKPIEKLECHQIKQSEEEATKLNPLRSCEDRVEDYWEPVLFRDKYFVRGDQLNCADLGQALVYFRPRINGVAQMFVFEEIPGAVPEKQHEYAEATIPVRATGFKIKLRKNEKGYQSPGEVLEHPYLEEVRVDPKFWPDGFIKGAASPEDKCTKYRLYAPKSDIFSEGTQIDINGSAKLRAATEEKFCDYLAQALDQWDAEREKELKQTEQQQKQTKEEQLKLLESPNKPEKK